MLRVWFYDPTHDSEGFINKIVAYADPPFCHCELQFPDLVACSIYMGSRVVMKARTFDRTHYSLVEVQATAEQTQLARQLCDQHHENQTAFSSMQMLACLAPWPGVTSSKYTFCSKLILGVLCDAGVLPPRSSLHVTPSELFRTLQREKQPDLIPELDFCEAPRLPQHELNFRDRRKPHVSAPELNFREVCTTRPPSKPTLAFELKEGYCELRI